MFWWNSYPCIGCIGRQCFLPHCYLGLSPLLLWVLVIPPFLWKSPLGFWTSSVPAPLPHLVDVLSFLRRFPSLLWPLMWTLTSFCPVPLLFSVHLLPGHSSIPVVSTPVHVSMTLGPTSQLQPFLRPTSCGSNSVHTPQHCKLNQTDCTTSLHITNSFSLF